MLAAGAESAADNAEARGSEMPERTVAEIAAETAPALVVVKQLGRDGSVEGTGAGFIVAQDGLIATSLHVIGEARPVLVELADGRTFRATRIEAWDRKLDLALIRVDANDLPFLALGDSDTVRQGARVVAMGNPRGFRSSVVDGVISAIRDFEVSPMFQLAMPIEPGNSGGPLLDRLGRVQGVITMKSALSDNIAFAMPVNPLKRLIEKPNAVPMERWLWIGALDDSRWTQVFGGKWTRQGGTLRVEGSGRGFGGRTLCLSMTDVPAPPYEVSVQVRLEDEAGAAGLVFESDGGDLHYGFYPSNGRMRLTHFAGADVFSWNVLAEEYTPAYRRGEWNLLKVIVKTNQVRAFVNDQLITAKAGSFSGEGRAGLAKFRNTTASFRRFRLRPVQSTATEHAAELRERIEEWLRDDSGELLDAGEDVHAARALMLARANELERNAQRLREGAAELHRARVRDELMELLSRGAGQVPLARAALLLAAHDDPDVEIEMYEHEIDRMAGELKGRSWTEMSRDEQVRELSKYLFEENGFHGSRSDYYNAANSHLSAVIDNREGLPISLAVLFVELARRCGLEGIEPLPVPGHFMVRHRLEDGTPRLIDVFDGGQIHPEEAAGEVIGRPVNAAKIEPATEREIVVRMIRNLMNASRHDGESLERLPYLDLLLALEPGQAVERLERALLRLRKGDRRGARADLERVIEEEPESLDVEQVRRLFESLTTQ